MLKRLKELGPGILVSAAFIGPGTITTATIAGATYGYTLLWAVAFSIIATILLQEMSARLGIVARLGVGEAIRQKSKHKIVRIFSIVLVVGAIGIGNAAYEAGNISGALLGFESSHMGTDAQQEETSSLLFGINPYVILIGILAFIVLFIGKYKSIERILTVLVALMGIVFLACAILLQPDIIPILRGLFIPSLPANAGLMVVGLIGTTVVPYNLFLHAASVKQKWRNDSDLQAARWDTIISVSLGGLITMAILICSAVAFEASKGSPESISGLASQLSPLLGGWSSNFMAFGFLAAGITSSITAPLAAAYAIQEIMGWQANMKSMRFRMVWMTILGVGVVFGSLGFKPVSIILFAQVANGLLLPIIASYLLWVMNDKVLMGKHINKPLVNLGGVLVILLAIGLGAKSILSVAGIL